MATNGKIPQKLLKDQIVGENEFRSDALTASGGLKGGNGTTLAVEPADFAGTGLEDDGSDNLRINLSTGSVTFTGGTWTYPVDVLQVTGTPDSANDAVNKAYVDNQITGIKWKDTLCALNLIGEMNIAAIDALSPSAGDSVVPTDAGTPAAGSSDALAAGDLAEYDGTQWKKLYANVAGQLPAGIRVTLHGTTALTSPFVDNTDDGRIVVTAAGGAFNGANSDWDDTGDAVDGNAVLVQCSESAVAESVNENNGYVFDGAVGSTANWIQFTGAGQLNAGAGLSKSGNTLNVGDAGRGVQVNANDVEVDASEASFSTGGIEASSNSWQFQIKTHAGASGAALTTDANGLNINGDVVDITYTPSNYTPTAPGGGDVDDLDAHLNGIDLAIAASGGTQRQELLTTQVISGSDTAMTDTLNNTPVSNAAVKLFYFGVLLEQGAGLDYTISGATITWLASSGTVPDQAASEPLYAVYES